MHISALRMSKRGQIGGPLGTTVGVVFGLFFIGILIFAFALAGANMMDATTDEAAINVINKTVEGATNFADFSPTLWIMAAIAALITILIGGIGVYFLSRQG